MKTAKKIRLYDLLILGALTSVSLLSSCQKKLDTDLSASDGMLRFEVSDAPQWQAGNVAASKAEPIDSASLKVQKIGDVWEDGQQMYLHTSVEPLGTIVETVESDTMQTAGVTTKGAVINQGKFHNTFGIMAMTYTGSSYNGFTPSFMYNVKASGGGNTDVIEINQNTIFQTTDKFYIPYGKTVALFAYAPYKESGSGTWISLPSESQNWPSGRPQYTVEVPQYLADQKDLCFAEAKASSNSNGRTTLNFQHAMAAVRFDIAATVPACTLKSVSLKNVRYKGTVIPNVNATSGWWTANNDERRNFTYNNGNSGIVHRGSSQTNVFGNEKAFFMIPQSITDVILEISVQVGTGNARTMRKTLTGSWTKGNKYTYTLSFSPEDPTTFEVNTTTTGGVNWANKVGTVNEKGGTYTFNIQSKKGTQARDYKVQYSSNGTSWNDLPANSNTLLIGLSKKTNNNGGNYVHTLQVFEKYTINSTQNTKLRSAAQQGSERLAKPLDQNSSLQRHTANCYIVSAPGYYSLETVYGNAYKNGKLNGDVIKSSGDTYQDYKGNPIRSPEFYANSARVLWTDVPGLISSIKLEGRLITFQIPAGTISEGNAVIGVFDGSGACMWSWHIWVTPSDALTKQSLPNPQAKTSPNVLTVPLGYVHPGDINWAAGQVYVRFVQSNGANGWDFNNAKQFTIKKTGATGYSPGRYTLYQWGRKDPIWPISVTASGQAQNAPTYPGPDGNTNYLPSLDQIEWPQEGSSVPLGASIGDLFKYPHRPYNRVASAALRKAFLWNASVAYSPEVSNTFSTKKSIYDPCPPGYKIAPPGTFDSFAHNGGTYLGGIQTPVDALGTGDGPTGGYGRGKKTALNYSYLDNKNRIVYCTISASGGNFPIPLLGGRMFSDSWQAKRLGTHFVTWLASRIDGDNCSAFGLYVTDYECWIDLYGKGNLDNFNIQQLRNALPILPVEGE